MAITGSIYSLAKKETDLTTKQTFENMMTISAETGAVVIDGRNLAAGTIFAEQIHADAITADKIKAGAIETDHMVAGSIDVDRLKANQLILPGETYGGVKINNEGISMKSTGLNVTLSSKSGFNITDKGGNQLIDIDPLTGNVIMQINEMIIGGHNAATQEDIEERVKNIELTPGPSGVDAPSINLSGASQIIKQDASGNVTPSTSFNITGVAVNTAITRWLFSVNGGAFGTGLPTGVTRSGDVVTVNPKAVTFNTLSIQAEDGTVTDTFTIGRAVDGDKGDKGDEGKDGADAYTVLLSNESHTFQAGTTNAIAGSTTTDIYAYKGTNKIAVTVGTITGMPTGMTRTISNNGKDNARVTFTVATNMTSPSGTVTINLTVDNKPIVKEFSYALTFKGEPGANAISGVLTNESITFAANSSGSVQNYVGNTGNFLLMEGAINRSSSTSITYSRVSQTNVNATISSNGAYTISSMTGGTSVTAGQVTFRATYKGTTIDKTVNVSKSIAGVAGQPGSPGAPGEPGSPGAPATSYWLTSSSDTITVKYDGDYDPKVITFYGYSKTGTSNTTTYAGRFIIQTSTNGTSYTQAYRSSSNQNSYAFTIPSNVSFVKAKFYQAGGTTYLLDEQTVPVLQSAENLEIGGRNLILGTGEDISFTNAIRRLPLRKEVLDGLIGEYITVSFYAVADINGQRMDTYFRNNDKSSAMTNEQEYFTLTTDNLRYSYTFKLSNTTNINSIDLALRNTSSSGGTARGNVVVSKLQVEHGNIATDWTPAPEDVEKAYTTVAEAKANLAKTQAEAYADGEITKEEKRAIQDAKDKLAEAKKHAEDKAGTAETNAKDYAKEQVDDIEIGGRNLARDTSDEYRTANHSQWYAQLSMVELSTIDIKPGDTVTLSFYAKTGSSGGSLARFRWEDSSGSNIANSHGTQIGTNSEGLVYVTAKVPTNAHRVRLVTNNVGNSNPYTSQYKKLKFEKGNKITDWTPAPEDVQAEIDSRPTFNDFDRTDKVTINGGNIKAGTISSDKNYSWIDLDKGHFSFGNGRLVWNGSDMTVNGKISVSNINGDIPKSKLASAVQTEINAGSAAKSTLDSKASTWDGKETTTGAQTKANTAEANAKELASAMAFGKMLYTDPTFKYGQNSVKVYNNSGGTGVTIDRIAKQQNAPTDSTHILRVTTSTAATTPGLGGFSFQTGISANKTYITRFIAKIPSGRSVIFASNATGSGGNNTRKWLSSNQGTGKWEEYVYKVTAGDTGSFSSTNFFYITGGSKPLTWYIAYATVFDVTDDDLIAHRTNAWSYNGTTEINGKSIRTGTLTADKIVMGTGTPSSGNLAAGRSFSGNYSGKVPGDGANTVGTTYATFGTGGSNNNQAESAYIQVDLGSTHQIAESRIFWYAQDRRRYYYKIKYSTNGSTWFYAVGNSNNNGWTVSRHPSSGSGGSYEPTIDRFAIPITARYLRIYGNGSTSNTSNHIYEWELYSKVQTTISGSEIVTGTLSADKITTGILADKDKNSWLNLTNGEFNFGKGGLVYSGGNLTVNGKLNVKNLDGKLSNDQIASATTWNTVTSKQNADSRLNNIISEHNMPYTKDIIVYGDSNKYYPVYVRGGNQNLFRTIKIWRTYGERGPNDWHTGSNSTTHKGSLMLTWKGNFGGWGGAVYREFIEENTSAYTTLLADCFRSVHSMAYTFMLRGGGSGGAIYHMASDQSLNQVEIYYNGSSDIVYPNSNANHVVKAANPVSEVNGARLEELKLAKSKEVAEVDSKASDAKNKTDGWTYRGETTIDGGAIEADTITATQIAANSITADEIDVDKISALASELGDVTAGTITSENGNIHIDLNKGLMEIAEGIFKIKGKDVADTEDLVQLGDKIDKEVELREGFISSNNGVITIGQKGSPTNIQIKNDRISFMQNGAEVAYITEQTMEITHGIFVKSAKIGEHKQQTLSGGHTVFTWEG